MYKVAIVIVGSSHAHHVATTQTSPPTISFHTHVGSSIASFKDRLYSIDLSSDDTVTNQSSHGYAMEHLVSSDI